MNKIYTSALAVLLAGAAMAQNGAVVPTLKEQAGPDRRGSVPLGSEDRGATIWSNDFSQASDWTIAHDGPLALDWQIGVGLEGTGGYPTPSIQSTTAGNGYAMLDSDGFNNSTTTQESSHMTTASPVDLSAYPNVILQFENQYRKYNNEQCYVVISTNNTDWPALVPTTDITSMPNVFYVWLPDGELNQGVSPGNPTVKRINISAVAGGQSQVWIRFHWTGIWGYTWFVDDVSVEEQAQYDIAMLNGFLSHTGTGEEYGRIPLTQIGGTMSVGGDYTNYGVQDQTNVIVDADAVAFSANTSSPVVLPDEILTMDEVVSLPALTPQLYTATFSVTSDEIASDGFPTNNTFLRTFEVTNDVFSLDGIDNHPVGYESLSSTGTNTFTDNSDGLFLFTMYPIAADFTVYGLDVLLANGTVEGGSIFGSLHDTTSVFGNDPASPIVESAEHIVTAADIAAGKVTLLFPGGETLSPGSYFAGVEMFSNTNANDIRVLDDLTVPQPFWTSSIHTPSDGTTYSNGNAYAIRLIADPSIGMSELSGLEGINVYPNPTDGLITISASTSEQHLVEVINMLGETVMTDNFSLNATMDLATLAKGVYTVRVSTATASAVQPVMIR